MLNRLYRLNTIMCVDLRHDVRFKCGVVYGSIHLLFYYREFFFFLLLLVGGLLFPCCWLSIFILLSNLWHFYSLFIIIVARHPGGNVSKTKTNKYARTWSFLWKSFPLRSCSTILKFRIKKNIYLLYVNHLCHSRPTYMHGTSMRE